MKVSHMGIRNHLHIFSRGAKTTSPAPEVAERDPAPQVKPSADAVEGPKLNLGSGHDNKAGWINIDMHERHSPDIVADVTKLVTH